MANKVITEKSRCANCISDKSIVLKQKSNKNAIGIILILNYLYTNHCKTCRHTVWSANKIQKMWIQKF